MSNTTGPSENAAFLAENRQAEVYAVATVFFVLSLLALSGRLAAARFARKPLWWDDWFAIIAAVSQLSHHSSSITKSFALILDVDLRYRWLHYHDALSPVWSRATCCGSCSRRPAESFSISPDHCCKRNCLHNRAGLRKTVYRILVLSHLWFVKHEVFPSWIYSPCTGLDYWYCKSRMLYLYLTVACSFTERFSNNSLSPPFERVGQSVVSGTVRIKTALTFTASMLVLQSAVL
jgi:hypothetical protein